MFNTPNEPEYNPSDPEVECFGLDIAITKRDVNIFKLLWSDYPECWDERHFSFLLTKIIKEQWEMGISLLFRSKTTHFIFKSLKKEDKDNFLGQKIVDKLQDHDFWATKNLRLSQRFVLLVIGELALDPFASYSVLQYPQFFYERSLVTLQTALKRVRFEDLNDFVRSRIENLKQFERFTENFTKFML